MAAPSGRAGQIEVKPPGYSAKIPLRLVEGEDGGHLWEVRNHSLVPRSAPEAAATPDHYPPEIRIQYTMRGSDLGVGSKRYIDGSRRAGRSKGVDTRFFETWMAGPEPQYPTALTGPGRDFAQMGGELYVGSSIYAYMLNRSTGDFDLKDMGPGEISGLVLCGATLYKAHGASYDWESSTNGTAWTPNSLSGDDSKAHRWEVTYSSTGKPQLWKSLLPNKLAVSTTPTSGGWSVYLIGDSDANIVDLRVVENVLYIIKEDGLWILLENGRARNIAPSWRHHRHSRQGFGANSEFQQLVVPTGKNSLTEVDQASGAMANISPAKSMADYREYSGAISCVISDGEWWYAFCQNPQSDPTNVTEVLVARRLVMGGTVIYPWNHLATLHLGRVDAAWIAILAGLGPRLYFSGRAQDVADGSAVGLLENKIGYISLPDSANPRYARQYHFVDDATIETGILQRFPGWETAFQELRLRTSDKGGESLGGGGRSVRAFYNVFDGQGFREVGGNTKGVFTKSPVETIYFRTTRSTGVMAEQIELRLRFNRDTNKSSAVVEELNLMGTVRPGVVNIFRFTVYAGDFIEGVYGRSNISAKRVAGALKSMNNPAWSTTLYDRSGDPHEVYVMTDGGLVERDIFAWPAGAGAEPVRVRAFQLTCFEVPGSDLWSREEIQLASTPNPITGTNVAAGTQVQFTATSKEVRAITFRARAGNADVMYIGDSGVGVADGLELSPGEAFPVAVSDTEEPLDISEWWFDAASSGDIIDAMLLET